MAAVSTLAIDRGLIIFPVDSDRERIRPGPATYFRLPLGISHGHENSDVNPPLT